jgi:hypothetical protein
MELSNLVLTKVKFKFFVTKELQNSIEIYT